MRRLIALCMVGLMVSASTAMAVGINFTENWEDDTAGAAPGAPWYVCAHDSGPLLVSAAIAPGPDIFGGDTNNSLHVHDHGATLNDLGVQALLTPCDGEPVVAGTDANPLALSYYMWFTHNRVTRDGDWSVELSLGDMHAPAWGTVLDEPIPVLAWGGVAGPGNKSMRYFDGKQWGSAGSAGAGNMWQLTSMTVKTNTVILVPVTDGPYEVARAYTGAFDRITIRSEDDQGTSHTYLDDVSVIGGICIPEPVTLMLLGVGGLLLRRRR